MFIDFTEEKLPKRKYILKLARHKMPGGWYVRIVTTEGVHGACARGEDALFISDPDHSWLLDDFTWEMIKKEPFGGIYRAKVQGGWLIFSTSLGTAQTDDGIKYHPRLGSLVFIADTGHEWECPVLEERDVFGEIIGGTKTPARSPGFQISGVKQ